jgi:hypothetical protein
MERENLLKNVTQLLACKEDIRDTLYKYEDQLIALKKLRRVELNTLLEVAQNLSYTDRAPDGWTPGAPLGKSHPPAPQPHEMRGGMLEKYHLDLQSKKVAGSVALDTTKTTGKKTKTAAEVRALADSIFNYKATLLAKKALEQASKSVEPQVNDASLEDMMEVEIEEELVVSEHVTQNKSRKVNISFNSYSDEESDDE